MNPRRTCVLLALIVSLSTVAYGGQAEDILKATNVKGGFVVHIGCGDGKLTAALRASESYVVHGLDTNPGSVAKARAHLMSLNLYGKVTIDRLNGTALPYIDNSVNLVVAESLGKVRMDEVMRVLCPKGVAYVKERGKWTAAVKTRPKDIDEWNHYMHGADNNAVAHDTVIGPLKSVQWVGSPKWARHHDRMASMSALVSANGRVFYIMDEGPTSSIVLAPKWKMVARDAFNGTLLWKRDIDKWFTHLWPLKSGPAVLPRRLVAVGDQVYVTLGLTAPLAVLDAASGKTIRTCKGTEGTEEILCEDGMLFLVVDKNMKRRDYQNPGAIYSYVKSPWWTGRSRQVMAVSAGTGETVWSAEHKALPLTLTLGKSGVYFHDGASVVCLDRKTGQEKWRSEPVPRAKTIYSYFAPTLVAQDGVLLFAGGEASGLEKSGGGARKDDTLTALAADTGKVLWKAPHPPSGYSSPEDLYVIKGLVWTGEASSGALKGRWTGRDLRTGAVKTEFSADVQTYWFHHRCHRGKATDKFVLTSRTGIEFLDLEKKHWNIHHWARGGCIYGVMPSNGLIYCPPHACACYLESKQSGFNALAAARGSIPKSLSSIPRLERGPAYSSTRTPNPSPRTPESWPTYRHDSARSGHTPVAVPAKLKPSWQTDLGGNLSSVVAADGKVFVASVNTHTVYALNAVDGKRVWAFTAGSRVDSPPTIYRGTALFGSADGHVYCVRVTDGALVWRFRAAPADRRLMAYEQLESVWPVSGSVLIQDDVLYCVAGRSMFLDGGLRFLKLDPKTGKMLGEKVLDDIHPTTGKGLQSGIMWLNMPVALPDVLSSDGKYVFMRSQRFDKDGGRHEVGPKSKDPDQEASRQTGEGRHLFCPTGFLDSAWFHRSYWMYGKTFCSGWKGYYRSGKHAPAGRILVHNGSRVYGFGRKPQYYKWTTPIEHRLFSIGRDEKPSGGGGASSGAMIQIKRTPSLSPVKTAITVEAWVNAAGKDGVILARGGKAHGYALSLQNGAPRFAVRASSTRSQVTAKQNIMGKWSHVVCMLTADKKLLIYVDGKEAASGKASSMIANDPAEAMSIGVDEGSAVDFQGAGFTGTLDEIRVYHRALDAKEIKTHAKGKAAPPLKDPKLVLCYTFDSGKADDASGKGNNGVVTEAEARQGKFGKAMGFGAAAPAAGGNWAHDVPILVRAMVLADKTLFIAGPPDLLDENEAMGGMTDDAIKVKLSEQDASFKGAKGGLLWAVNTSDASKLAEYKLDSPPVFDSMIAANGCIYFATVDGKVVCYAAEGNR